MKKYALLLIDIQKGLDELDYYGGHRNNPNAEKNAGKLLEAFRLKKLLIFHVRHSSQNSASPLHASKPGFQFKEEVIPQNDEPVFTKNVNSAFIGTDLENELKSQQIENLIIAGLTSEHCISTSVRMASNLGFKVILVDNACAAFDKISSKGTKIDAALVHEVTMANLNGEFAQVLTTTEVLELLA